MSVASSELQCENNVGMCGISLAVEANRLPKSQGSARGGDIQRNHNNRCFPVRMGSDDVGQNGELNVGSEFDWLSHKHFGVAVFLPVKHFLPFLLGYHILVKPYNSTVVAYINHQGGTITEAAQVFFCFCFFWGSSGRLLSLRATCTRSFEQRSGSQVVHIWQKRGRAAVDIFALLGNAQFPLFFSLSDKSAPLGVDALAQPCPDMLLYAFPLISLISPTLISLIRVREHCLIDHDRTTVAVQTFFGGNNTVVSRRALATPIIQGSPVPGVGDLPPTPRTHGALCLARGKWPLSAAGLPQQVIDTIQNARVPSTPSL